MGHHKEVQNGDVSGVRPSSEYIPAEIYLFTFVAGEKYSLKSVKAYFKFVHIVFCKCS